MSVSNQPFRSFAADKRWRRKPSRRLFLETLERRLALSTVEISQDNGVLFLTGDRDTANPALVDDDVSIAFSNGAYRITGNNGTTLTPPAGSSQVTIPAAGITAIRVSLGAGNDVVRVNTADMPLTIEVAGGTHAATPTTAVAHGRNPNVSSVFVAGVVPVPLGDALIIDDSTSPTADAAYTISGTRVTRNGAALVAYPDSDFERLSLTTGAGNNDVTADLNAGALPPIVQVFAGTGDTQSADNRFQVEGSPQGDNISIRDFVQQTGDVPPALPPPASGPLAVTYDNDAQSLVSALRVRPLPAGVTITGATYSGSPTSAGRYVNGDAVPLGIFPQGIILTSGDANVPTSNTAPSFGADVGQPGDADLETLANVGNPGTPIPTYDAAVLTLTIEVAPGSGIQSGAFNFQFGSEEYPEFVGDTFNDVVGAFINGGSASNVMRDSQGNLVSINSVFFDEDNTGGTRNFEYDGSTSALVTRFPLQVGTNTLKIAIADAGDEIYDSAVFLADLRFSTQAVGSGGTARAATNAHFELSGFQRLWARGHGGNDVIDNASSVPGLLEGGDSNDAINSDVAHSNSVFTPNPQRPQDTIIRNVSLALGGGGADQLFTGGANSAGGQNSGISFLIGDYSAGGHQSDGTYISFAQSLSRFDSYFSAANAALHGYIRSPDDPVGTGVFAYAASTLYFLYPGQVPTGPYIFPAAYNPLLPQLQAFTRPVPPAAVAPIDVVTPAPDFAIDAALDVNQDGSLSPGDALLVINDLNANGSRPVAQPTGNGEGEPLAAAGASPLLDANQDRYVTPADALVIINAINARSQLGSSLAGGEGEADATWLLAAEDELAGYVAAGGQTLDGDVDGGVVDHDLLALLADDCDLVASRRNRR